MVCSASGATRSSAVVILGLALSTIPCRTSTSSLRGNSPNMDTPTLSTLTLTPPRNYASAQPVEMMVKLPLWQSRPRMVYSTSPVRMLGSFTRIPNSRSLTQRIERKTAIRTITTGTFMIPLSSTEEAQVMTILFGLS